MQPPRVDKNALTDLVRPAVEGQGYELVDVEWTTQLGSFVLRITIDRLPGQGYVSHDDCIAVSREVSALLDVHDVMPGCAYNLEVSSPGLNRPLRRSADFARFIGQRAKIRLREGCGIPQQGANASKTPRRNFTGTLSAVAGELVSLTTDDGEKVDLSVEDIEKANLIYPF
jgi:ribosome maturation factor RimP